MLRVWLIRLLSLALLLVSLWQIEEIWRSVENGWLYNLPFGLTSGAFWFWHDFWFCMIVLAWLLMMYGKGVVVTSYHCPRCLAKLGGDV